MLDNVRRVSRQLVAYGTADVATLAINVLLLPLYTRVLSPREYGAFALLIVFEGFLKPVFRWGLDTAYVRFYYDQATEHGRRTLAGTITIFLTVVNGVLLLCFLLAAPAINQWLLDTDAYVTAFLLLVVNSFVSNVLFLPLGLLRIQERAPRLAALNFSRALGTILLRILFVLVLRLSVLGLFMADLIATLVLLGWLGGTFRSMIELRFSMSSLRPLLRFGFPQLPHGLLSQTMALSDRFVLGLFFPLAQVGLYLIGATIASTIKFFPVAFEAAWMPFAFDSMRRKDAPALFARMASYAFAVLVFLSLAVVTLADSAVRAMLPSTYHAATAVVPVLVLGIMIQSLSWFLGTSLNIAKQTRVYPLATGMGAATSLTATVLLVPRLGLMGAAWGVLAGQTAATVVTGYFAQRSYWIPYEGGRLARVVLIATAAYVLIDQVTLSSAWFTLVLRALLLSVFPLGLFVLRFFQGSETDDLRTLAAAVTGIGRRTAPQAARPTAHDR